MYSSNVRKVLSVIVIGLGAVGTLMSVALLWQMPLVLTAVLVLISAFMLFYHKSKSVLFVYVFGFFFGPITEIVAISHGAWSYAAPHLFGVPFWLPFVWGAASITIISAYLYVKREQ